MSAAVAEHRLRSVVDRVFELGEAREALSHLERGEHGGKVCIRL
jgi:NADPH:quinone reductase-like Zn-dependent oxidoreductase